MAFLRLLAQSLLEAGWDWVRILAIVALLGLLLLLQLVGCGWDGCFG